MLETDVSSAWDAASAGYADHVAPRMMTPFADAIVEQLGVSRQHEVLEVGAGSGALTLALAGRSRSLLATDLSPEMVSILQARAECAGVDNLRCVRMDGQALSVPDACFDRVASSFAVMLFPDRARGMRELHRALRPGGRAVLSAWCGPELFECFGIFLAAVAHALPDLPPPPGPPPVFSLADPDRFGRELRAAGFAAVEVRRVAREVSVQHVDVLWTMITAGAPPVQTLLDRVGPQGAQRIRESLAGIVSVRFGAGPIRLVNHANIASGVRPTD